MSGILVVDDNPGIRYLLRVFVETQTSFKVCGEAGHGSEAIQRAKELQPDLVLIDLSMPVLSGVEAASVIENVMRLQGLLCLREQSLGTAFTQHTTGAETSQRCGGV